MSFQSLAQAHSNAWPSLAHVDHYGLLFTVLGRETSHPPGKMEQLGHDVRPIPPAYVKPYVKRQKNDAADAEAIAEAATGANMLFVEIESDDQQAQGMLFRTRELLIRQRTQAANALRAHLSEFGVTVPKGIRNIDRLSQSRISQVAE